MKTKLRNAVGLFILTAGLAMVGHAQIFTTIHNLSAADPNTDVSDDGTEPLANLTLSGDTLYGTAFRGGATGGGVVFALKTNGSSFTNLHTFTWEEGASPQSPLILSGNTVYGTVPSGVFAVNTDGTGFTNLVSNMSWALEMVLSSNVLYGIDDSHVFAVHTDGSGFTNLHTFNGIDGTSGRGIALSGNTLYGTTTFGGTNGG